MQALVEQGVFGLQHKPLNGNRVTEVSEPTAQTMYLQLGNGDEYQNDTMR